MLHLVIAMLLTIAVGLSTSVATAATVPGFDKPLHLSPREQPIELFFQDLFGQIGLAVNVDSSLRGTVNGDFKDSADEIYRDVAKAFNVSMYYDHSKVFLYPSSERARRMLSMSAEVAERVYHSVKKQGLINARNTVSLSDMGLVVSGYKQFQEQIQGIAGEYQKRTNVGGVPSDHTLRVFKLKYAWADDTTQTIGGQSVFVPGVASVLRTLLEPGIPSVDHNPYGSSQSSKTPLPRTRPKLKGRGLQSVGENAKRDIGESATKGLADVSTASGVARSSYADTSTSSTRIVAEPLSNSIIIRDRPERMQNYEDIITTLDMEPKMVEIEATIIDMDTDKLRSLGVDWRVDNARSSALFSDSNASAQSILTPGASANAITSSDAGGILSLVLGNRDQFISRVRALETQGAARIVSKPHVLTLSNVEAQLDTTSTFHIRVQGQEEVDLFNVSVGTLLRVTPHVSEDHDQAHIKLNVNIVDGSQSSQQVDAIPVIEESTITTQAFVNAGESLLIGGLVREAKTNTVSKVPVLGDIPLIGTLFRNNNKSSSRVERMFLITPRLNLRPKSSKRYSVPILSGSEAEIIESAPARLEPALARVASRDVGFSVEEELPIGYANPKLVSATQPLPVYIPANEVDDSRPQSIRERLRGRQHSTPGLSPDIPVVNPPAVDSSNIVDSDRQDSIKNEMPKRNNSEWQVIQSNRALSRDVVVQPQAELRKQTVPARAQLSEPALSVPIEDPRVATDNSHEWKTIESVKPSAPSVPLVKVLKTEPADDAGWKVVGQ